MKTPLLVPLLALTVALPLSGCISFGAKPPPSLLTLEAASSPAVGQEQSSAGTRSIVIQVPSTPAAIATQRIPVQKNATEIAYVPDALWSEPPARLFARLLSDTVTARSRMVVLSTVQSFEDPSATLTGELRHFGIDATARQAVVTYDAALTRAGATAVEKRRFEAMAPISEIEPVSSGAALNQAANSVATQVADWVAQGR